MRAEQWEYRSYGENISQFHQDYVQRDEYFRHQASNPNNDKRSNRKFRNIQYSFRPDQ